MTSAFTKAMWINHVGRALSRPHHLLIMTSAFAKAMWINHAEELFSYGVILPIDPNVKHEPPKTLPPLPLVPSLQPHVDHAVESHGPKCDQSSNETVVSVFSESHDQKQNFVKSSVWQFKRSSSLNCGSGYARALCPIPLLFRSHSTGSTSSTANLW
ncbi:hypothetical protein OROHE_001101 [Orobanche hederae]